MANFKYTVWAARLETYILLYNKKKQKLKSNIVVIYISTDSSPLQANSANCLKYEYALCWCVKQNSDSEHFHIYESTVVMEMEAQWGNGIFQRLNCLGASEIIVHRSPTAIHWIPTAIHEPKRENAKKIIERSLRIIRHSWGF